MARWAHRIPDTPKCRVQTENWLRRLSPGPSWSHATVLRLTRLMELRGVTDVYAELRSMHPSLVDYTNDVVYELRRRAA